MESQSTPTAKEKLFNSLLDVTRKHTELVFHRFLSPDPGKKRVAIVMNGDELEAHNPFNPNRLATQELDEHKFSIEGEEIRVQPYVLPHLKKVSRQEYEKYAGEGGYLQNQGFYIYRNRRLIIKGTWFRLIKKSYLNQLIRIRVDIPNTLDRLWRIDVKKSNASIPESVKRELRQIIGKIEIKGKRVFEQKGQKLASKMKIPVWNRRAAGGSIIYEINREYPLIEQLLKSMSLEQKGLLKDLISVCESSFPADMFFNDFASNPEHVDRPEFDNSDLEKLIETFISFWSQKGIERADIIDALLSTEPFALSKDYCKNILQRKGYLP
jgi:rRNA-processing protein FCF1